METSRFHCHRSNANLFLNVAFVRNDPHATSTAGWRLIIFPCGMPACVTPRGTSHSTKGSLVLLCIKVFFCTSVFFSLPAAGLFSSSRLRGTQGARPNTTAQVWALAEVRGTCSGGSKVASNHGEPFQERTAIQAHANPKTGEKNVRRLTRYLGS